MLAALIVVWVGGLIAAPPRPSSWLVLLSGLPVLALISARLARRAGRSWADHVKATPDLHAFVLVLLYALGVLLADSHGISTDGVTYFAQLRSVVFDRDLDIGAEYAFLGQPPRPNYVVPVGPILVWVPLYLAVAAVDAVGRGLGVWAGPADAATLGLGLAYVRAAVLSSFAVGGAGLFAVLWYLRGRFTPAVAFIATLLVFGATPLYWYMVYEPSMTHAASFGFVALFVVLSSHWLRPAVIDSGGSTERSAQSRPDPLPSSSPPEGRSSALPAPPAYSPPPPSALPTPGQSALLGSLLALAFLARSQEALFVVYPVLLVATMPGVPVQERVRGGLRVAGWAFLGAVPWLLVQVVHGYLMLSTYEYNLLGQGGYFNPLRSRWIDTLFSSWHGFLSWTPVAYLAVIGTVAYLRREWRWAAATLAILFLTAWVNGSTQDWAGGWSFGGRRFSSSLVMLAPGLAIVVEFGLRRPLVALAPVVVAALWWNHLLMVQYTAGMLPKDEPVSFGRIVRQQAELHTRSPYWYPFAFPANVWFAWREGVPIDKYDVLSPVTPAPSFSLTFDRRAEPFLLSGWDVPGGDDWGPSWWIGGSPATMAIPLAVEANDVTIRVRTRTRFEEPPVRALLALEVNGREVGRFAAGLPDATTSEFVVPAAEARTLFRRGFNQVAFRSLGVESVDPADTRPPGPLASRQGRQVWPVAVYSLEVVSGVH